MRRRSAPAHFADNAADGGALGGVELGHHVVCWVADHRAEDSSDVPGRKGHSQLLCLAALRLGLGHHILVQRHHRVLKAGCMHTAHLAQHIAAKSAALIMSHNQAWTYSMVQVISLPDALYRSARCMHVCMSHGSQI